MEILGVQANFDYARGTMRHLLHDPRGLQLRYPQLCGTLKPMAERKFDSRGKNAWQCLDRHDEIQNERQ
jgi:hypothetical protein